MTQPRPNESGDPRYAWLNNRLVIGHGGKVGDEVRVSLFEIL